MYDLFVAVIMGIVEGLTEFLPVSSTGHLIFTGHILGFVGDKAEAFEVIIQLGAILAVVFLYWEKFLFLLKIKPFINRLTGLFSKTKIESKGLTLVEIIAGMIPVIILGFLLRDLIKSFGFENNISVAIALIVGGFLLIAVEKVHVKTIITNVDDITVKQAFKIGLMQCLSLWPGFSRAGATISGGVFFGLDRKAAAEFSFILAVPIMLAASSLELIDIAKGSIIFGFNDIIQLLVGFVISFIVAYFAIVYFIKLLSKTSFIPFAVYRILLGIVALLVIIPNN